MVRHEEIVKRILVVDDEQNIGRTLKLILEREGYAVSTCALSAKPERWSHRVDAYMLDVRLPDGSGIDLLRELRQRDLDAPAIMISGHGTISDAVEATRAGAYDFLEKPLSRDRVLLALKNALEQSNLRQENARLRELVGPAGRMIGSSPAWQRVVDYATMAARSDARVLLTGESGTGKELLAAHIHQASPFSAGPFVKVNCAAIPTELIESELFGHDKGAFTGAAGDAPRQVRDGGRWHHLPGRGRRPARRVPGQAAARTAGGRVPPRRWRAGIRVTVRVIAATNRDFSEMVAQERFREDLYYRLNVVPIRVPSLRERPQDVRALAEYFLDDFCRRNNFKPRSFDPDTFELLDEYSWPGNVRELRNTVERMAILSPKTNSRRMPCPSRFGCSAKPPPKSNLREARESAERDHILKALEQSGWNVSGAARALGMERTNLHKRMKALGLGRDR